MPDPISQNPAGDRSEPLSGCLNRSRQVGARENYVLEAFDLLGKRLGVPCLFGETEAAVMDAAALGLIRALSPLSSGVHGQIRPCIAGRKDGSAERFLLCAVAHEHDAARAVLPVAGGGVSPEAQLGSLCFSANKELVDGGAGAVTQFDLVTDDAHRIILRSSRFLLILDGRAYAEARAHLQELAASFGPSRRGQLKNGLDVPCAIFGLAVSQALHALRGTQPTIAGVSRLELLHEYFCRFGLVAFSPLDDAADPLPDSTLAAPSLIEYVFAAEFEYDADVLSVETALVDRGTYSLF